jgi:hypothetical protein
VELQVEEYVEPKARERFDGSRAFCRKQLATHLHQARGTLQLASQGTRRREAVYIQGDD